MGMYGHGSQAEIKTYLTVAAAEVATGVDNDKCYIVETETFARYETSGGAYTRDGLFVYNTGDGGNTRWLGVAGKYSLASALRTIIKASTGVLTAEECMNTNISNYGQAAECTRTLPTAGPGMSFLSQVITTGNALHHKAGASDKIYLNGNALDDGDKVSLATPVAGDCAAFWTWVTGSGTYDWYCNVIQGAWADGGA